MTVAISSGTLTVIRYTLLDATQQFAGHFPDAEAMDRARRVLVGETSIEDARDELRKKYNVA